MAIVPIPLSSLLVPETEDDALASILSLFQSLGFQVTSWQSGGIGLTVARFLAQVANLKSTLVAQVAASGFLDLCSGDWLTLLAHQFWGVDRNPAVSTVGTFTLTSSTGAPIYQVQPNQLWIENPSSGMRFTNTTGGILASGPGATLPITVQAEEAGDDWNISAGATLTIVADAIPGVTASNAVGWITTSGTDAEADEALRIRCRAKWGTIASGDPATKYLYYALSTVATVTRAYVDDTNPGGPGTVYVYLAGAAGRINDAPTIALVDAALKAVQGECVTATAYDTTDKNITITGAVSCRGKTPTEVQKDVEANLTALFAALPIGGEVIGSASGKVFLDAIIGAIRAAGSDGVSGVLHVALSAPAADTTLDVTEVATVTYSGLTYSAA